MPIPVIDDTESVLQYAQWQAFEFATLATNTPTSWTLSGTLPTGVTLNTTTGVVFGTPSVPGVKTFGLTANNADGASTPVSFTVGIRPAAVGVLDDSIGLTIDVASRLVSISGGALALTPELEEETFQKQEPLFWLKSGDARIFNVNFVNNGVPIATDLASLKLSLDSLEPEPSILVASSWVKVGTGTGAYYRLVVVVESTGVASALSDAEEDFGTRTNVLGEIEWTYANPISSGPAATPATLRGTTRNYIVKLERELAPNA